MDPVITYQHAHLGGTVALCAAHADSESCPPLGPVSHGQHEGPCDLCESEWAATQPAEPTYTPGE